MFYEDGDAVKETLTGFIVYQEGRVYKNTMERQNKKIHSWLNLRFKFDYV